MEKGRQLSEIEKWEKRVFYPNEKFKTDTAADLEKLDNFLNKSKDKFLVIISSSEASVYKIGHYMVEKGLKNSDITFQDSSLLEVYIDPDARFDYQYRNLCTELCQSIKDQIRGKWLVIPYLDNVWNKKLAAYFINELDIMGCYGLLFYSPKNVAGNLAQTLCEESYSDNILQFPEVKYQNRHKGMALEDDGY